MMQKRKQKMQENEKNCNYREALDKNGISYTFVADEMGIARQYLMQLLDGSRPWPPHRLGQFQEILNEIQTRIAQVKYRPH